MKPPKASPAPDKTKRPITTPEGLTLTLTLASRGARLGALLLDLVIIMVLIAAITIGIIYLAIALVGHTKDAAASHAGQASFIAWTIAMFCLRNAWFLAFELGPRGATPGKRVLGIRIAARDGGRLTPEMVIARNLLRDVEIFVPLTLIGMTANGGGDIASRGTVAAVMWVLIFTAMPLYNRNRLRAGDLVAGTWVVETPRRRLEATLSKPAAHAPTYHFTPADLATYGEFELQALERVLRESNSEAMAAVAQTICAKIHWSPPGVEETRPFLEAYYTQLRAKLETGMQMGKRKANKFEGV